MRTTISTILSALCLLAVFGCSLDDLQSDTPPPHALKPMMCTTDSDCEDDHRNCQHGLCVDGPKDATMRLSATVYPPPNEELLSQLTYRNSVTELGAPITIALPRTVSVTGSVSQPGKEKLGRVQVFFSRLGDVAGRRYTNNTTTDAQGNFGIMLPTGEYSVSLRTEWEDFPEHNTTLTVDDATEGSIVYFDLPPEDAYVRWTGRLVRLDENLATHAVPDVTLWAQDTNSSARSSLSVNDKNGVFSFYMSRDVKSFQIQIRPRTIEDGDQIYAIPSSTFPPIYAEYSDEGGQTQEIPGYEMVIGQLKPSIPISGTVVDSSGNPVEGARILARTRIPTAGQDIEDASPSRSTVQESTVTDENGAYAFLFPPYDDITLTAFDTQDGPRLSDAQHMLNLAASNADAAQNIELTLADAQSIDFDIRDASGAPVEYFDVNFELNDSDLLSARNYDARGEELGGIYTMRPDAAGDVRIPNGEWNVTVSPRSDLTLPHFWFFQRVNQRSTTIKTTLPEGVVAAFNIEDERGEIVRGATVELWVETEDPATGQSTTQLLGSGQSDADGRATVLVPHIPYEAPVQRPSMEQ